MNYRHVVFIFICGIFFMCHTVHADVIVNEIAWMGTATSANDEWIELFNSGTSAVTVDGWTLKASDGSPSINLTGSISAGGYMLLERTDDNTIPAITAGVIYSGAMSNTGENFSLKNNTEQVIDTVNMTSGWTAGNATTKETMQRKGSTWITGAPTPSAANVTVNNDPNDEDPPDDETNSAIDEEEAKIFIRADSVYSAQMIIPEIIIQKNPAVFDSTVKKDGKGLVSLGGRFEWTMGDGGSYIFDRSTSFNYIYHYPGTYVVILRYYSDSFKEEPNTIHKQTITVIPASVSVSINHTNGLITLSNQSTNELNIGNWDLKSSNQSFRFPVDTVIPKDGSVLIPFQIHKLSNWSQSPSLFTSDGYNTSEQKTKSITYSSTPTIQPIAQPEPIEESLFSSAEAAQVIEPSVKGNFRNMLWIAIFMIILLIANIVFVIVGKRIENAESVVNNA